jgi:aspartate/glutamate racemase
MTEEVKSDNTDINTVVAKNSATVTFGGTEYTIERLKAGKFYQALKVYMSIIKEVTGKMSSKKISDKGAEKEGEEKELDMDLNELITSLFESWPTKTAEFVAICCSDIKLKVKKNQVEEEIELTNESLLANAYSEEITNAFQTCATLNQVSKSLKNFVAPIEGLGATMSQINN